MKDRLLLLSAAVCLGLILGCPKPKPKPPTPPSQPPAVEETGRPTRATFPELLLRVQGGRFVVGSTPVVLAYAIPCWPAADADGKEILRANGKALDYWWPLVSPAWVEAATAVGFNAFHLRMGPFGELCCGNEAIGNTTTQAWWDRVHVALRAVGKAKAFAEVDVLDGWQVKHAIWGEVSVPGWPAEHVHGAAQVPLNPSVLAHVDRVVQETCWYHHVAYQIGNETSLMPGWTEEWERAMHAAIRAAEAKHCGVVHVIGSNNEGRAQGPWDYAATHDPSLLTGPQDGKPIVVNEYNPPLPPLTWFTRHCQSKAAGQSFGYWLGGAPAEDVDAVFAMMAKGCDAAPALAGPFPPRDRWRWKVEPSWGGFHDPTPLVFSACEYMAAIGMGDYNGTMRCSGPVRNECGPTGKPVDGDPASFQCDQRLAYEQWLIEAPGPVWTSDGVVEVDGSGWRAKCSGCSWLKVCNGPGTVCTTVQP